MAAEDESFSKESNFPSEIARKLKKRHFEEMMVVDSDLENIRQENDSVVKSINNKSNLKKWWDFFFN